jgi:hypothetical protein
MTMSEKLYPLALAILAVVLTLALHVIVGLIAGIPLAMMTEVLVATGLIGMLLAGIVGFVLGRHGGERDETSTSHPNARRRRVRCADEVAPRTALEDKGAQGHKASLQSPGAANSKAGIERAK